MIESGDITAVPVATSRYLPDGVVWLYEANGASNLTLGQLANTISVRLACVYELRSVGVMNRMSSSDLYIQAMSAVAQQVVGSGSYTDRANVTQFGYGVMTVKEFLLNICGISSSSLPADLNSFDNRMTAFKQVKAQLDTATSQAQDLAVTLKTCINRRDVAYTTSTNVSKHYNSTMLEMANRLK